MKSIVTGARGTVGSVLCRRIAESGSTAVGWDRSEAPPGNSDAARRLFDRVQPEAVYHVALPSVSTGIDNEGWLVNEKWTADIGALALERGIPFLYISTVMVYTSTAQGPFRPDTPPDETEGYGYSKLLGEQAARAANPDVRVARFGWQIGDKPEGNNMIYYLDKQFRETGEITASTRWLPATSFIEDTADSLIRIAGMAPGTYHIDGNRGWNFFEIVTALNLARGGHWKVRPTDDFSQVQCMTDPRPSTAPLSRRLALRPVAESTGVLA
jgi:dTDP-4-dehydrorhamnose reductase